MRQGHLENRQNRRSESPQEISWSPLRETSPGGSSNGSQEEGGNNRRRRESTSSSSSDENHGDRSRSPIRRRLTDGSYQEQDRGRRQLLMNKETLALFGDDVLSKSLDDIKNEYPANGPQSNHDINIAWEVLSELRGNPPTRFKNSSDKADRERYVELSNWAVEAFSTWRDSDTRSLTRREEREQEDN